MRLGQQTSPIVQGVPRHFPDGHVSDRHISDGQILDRALWDSFQTSTKTGHFLDRTFFIHNTKIGHILDNMPGVS